MATPKATDAPAKDAPTTDAPVALATQAADETVTRAERVYVDLKDVPRVLLGDGRACAVQREKRADGTDGPIMLAFVRGNVDGRESATRYPLADIQRAQRAYADAGLVLVEQQSS